MAKAAKLSIVEAENIVEVGEIDPNDVDLPGIFIDRIVPATEAPLVEILKTRSAEKGDGSKSTKGDAQLRRDRIAKRAAKELKDGFYVNLGVGELDVKQGWLGGGQACQADSLLFPQESPHSPLRSCHPGSMSGSNPKTGFSGWGTTHFLTKSTREILFSQRDFLWQTLTVNN
jgi:hypothetical protein